MLSSAVRGVTCDILKVLSWVRCHSCTIRGLECNNWNPLLKHFFLHVYTTRSQSMCTALLCECICLKSILVCDSDSLIVIKHQILQVKTNIFGGHWSNL